MMAETLQKCSELFQIPISSDQIDKFTIFADELRKWNRKINLTAIEGDQDIALKHFFDSLLPHKYLDLTGRLLDIGSGGGFPAIPLRIVTGLDEVLSVDSIEKKINFQRHVARLLKLERFGAIHSRGELLSGDHSKAYDIVISRAFSDIPKFVQIASPLIANNGKIVAMKGLTGAAEAKEAEGFLAENAMRIDNVIEYSLPLTGDRRSLVVIERVK